MNYWIYNNYRKIFSNVENMLRNRFSGLNYSFMNKGISASSNIRSWLSIIPNGDLVSICSIQLTTDKKWQVSYIKSRSSNGKWTYETENLPDKFSFAYFQFLESIVDKAVDRFKNA